MRAFVYIVLLVLPCCVDPYKPALIEDVDIVIVNGTITNLDEPQVVQLSRSKSFSGRYGNLPITGARVEVVVDSMRVIPLMEQETGLYYLPDGFRGEVGHVYQLRFWLEDQSMYVSTPEVLRPAPPITGVRAQFNPTSLPPHPEGYRAAHDLYLDVQDPPGERNYYKWEWKLWEKQEWCRTCYEGGYAVYNVFFDFDRNVYQSGSSLFEDCFYPPKGSAGWFQVQGENLDYPCRTRCWEILHSREVNVFDDALTNGGVIQNRKVAQIPYYQASGCLVELQQLALSTDAYRFYKQLYTQTQSTGSIVDAPPAVLQGNVYNQANAHEIVMGYFMVAGAATVRYWLDRKDATGKYRGLFQSLNGGRDPIRETNLELFVGGPPRVPTATCEYNNHQTPLQPEGWQE